MSDCKDFTTVGDEEVTRRHSDLVEKPRLTIIQNYGYEAAICSLHTATGEEGELSWINISRRPHEFVDFLTSLKANDVERILKRQDRDGNSALHYMVTTNHFCMTLRRIYDVVGGACCIRLIALKNKAGLSTVVQSVKCLKFTEVMKIFTAVELEEILADRDCDGLNTLHFIILSKVAKMAMKYIYTMIGGWKCVSLMNSLDSNGRSSFGKAILEKVGSIEDILEIFTCSELEQILENEQSDGRNTMWYLLRSKTGSLKLACDTLGGEKCLNLLINSHKRGGACELATALESNAHALLQVLNMFDGTELWTMLNSTDIIGQSLIYHILNSSSMEFKWCLKSISERLSHSQLLRLVEDTLQRMVKDSNMSTQYRRNVAKIFTSEVWQLLISKCSKRHQDMTEWAQVEIEKSSYLLPCLPSMLIFYATRDRPGVEDESKTLRAAWNSIGLPAQCTRDFTKDELLYRIRETQSSEAGYSCQIVVIFSHGGSNFVLDNEDTPLSIADIEKTMSPKSHANTPKLLLIQCCQSSELTNIHQTKNSRNQNGESQRSGTSVSRTSIQHYSPTNPDFCVILSTASPQADSKNQYIHQIANQIRNLQMDQDLHAAFIAAHRSMAVDTQTPLHFSTLRYNLCLKNAFKPDDDGRTSEPGCLVF